MSTTLTHVSRYIINDWQITQEELEFNREGTRAYTRKGVFGGDYFVQHTLTTPWDLSTASASENRLISNAIGLSICPTGEYVYYRNYSTNAYHQCSFSGTLASITVSAFFVSNIPVKYSFSN